MAPKLELNPDLIALARTLHGAPPGDEYERMVSGMMYSPLDSNLLGARHHSRCLKFKFNSIDPNALGPEEASEKRTSHLQEWLGKVGLGSYIEGPLTVDMGCNTIVGKNTFINFNCTILDVSLVTIGERVWIGPNVNIFATSHDTSILSRRRLLEYGLPIIIEDDCWIGGAVTILQGVTIGRGSSIGAGSVVTKNIPPYSVAVGSPAKVIKTVQTVEEELADPANLYRDMPDLLQLWEESQKSAAVVEE